MLALVTSSLRRACWLGMTLMRVVNTKGARAQSLQSLTYLVDRRSLAQQDKRVVMNQDLGTRRPLSANSSTLQVSLKE